MEYNYPSFDSMTGTGATTISALDDPQRANAALDELISAGPAPEPPTPTDTHWMLPVGIEPEPGASTARDARVRELTGADEEELARSGTNPFRFFDAIIRRGTVELGTYGASQRLLRSLTIADRDTLLLGIRIATYGPEYTWEGWLCPQCGEASDLTFHLDEVEITSPPLGQREYVAELRGGQIARLRLPTGEDQAKLYEREDLTIPEQNSIMIGRCVLDVTDEHGRVVPGNPELGRQLGLADRLILIKAMTAHTFGPRMDEIKITHEACGKEVKVPLGFSALFR